MIVFSLELFSFLDDVEDHHDEDLCLRLENPGSRLPAPSSCVLCVLTQCMVKSGERQRSSIEPLGVVFPAPPAFCFVFLQFSLLLLLLLLLYCPPCHALCPFWKSGRQLSHIRYITFLVAINRASQAGLRTLGAQEPSTHISIPLAIPIPIALRVSLSYLLE